VCARYSHSKPGERDESSNNNFVAGDTVAVFSIARGTELSISIALQLFQPHYCTIQSGHTCFTAEYCCTPVQFSGRELRDTLEYVRSNIVLCPQLPGKVLRAQVNAEQGTKQV